VLCVAKSKFTSSTTSQWLLIIVKTKIRATYTKIKQVNYLDGRWSWFKRLFQYAGGRAAYGNSQFYAVKDYIISIMLTELDHFLLFFKNKSIQALITQYMIIGCQI